jgi:hypothetical protein
MMRSTSIRTHQSNETDVCQRSSKPVRLGQLPSNGRVPPNHTVPGNVTLHTAAQQPQTQKKPEPEQHKRSPTQVASVPAQERASVVPAVTAAAAAVCTTRAFVSPASPAPPAASGPQLSASKAPAAATSRPHMSLSPPQNTFVRPSACIPHQSVALRPTLQQQQQQQQQGTQPPRPPAASPPQKVQPLLQPLPQPRPQPIAQKPWMNATGPRPLHVQSSVVQSSAPAAPAPQKRLEASSNRTFSGQKVPQKALSAGTPQVNVDVKKSSAEQNPSHDQGAVPCADRRGTSTGTESNAGGIARAVAAADIEEKEELDMVMMARCYICRFVTVLNLMHTVCCVTPTPCLLYPGVSCFLHALEALNSEGPRRAQMPLFTGPFHLWR